jgi:hypothetical protein
MMNVNSLKDAAVLLSRRDFLGSKLSALMHDSVSVEVTIHTGDRESEVDAGLDPKSVQLKTAIAEYVRREIANLETKLRALGVEL